MDKNDKYKLSREYSMKKQALLRSLDKCGANESYSYRRASLKFTLVIALAVVLTVSAFAAKEYVHDFFKVDRGEGKTVIKMGSTDHEEGDSVTEVVNNNGTYTFISASDIDDVPPQLIFRKDYLPEAAVDSEDGNGIKFGDFDSGTAVSFSVVYLGGRGYTCSFGADAVTEEFTVNSHSALFVRLSETLYFNRVFYVYFEEYDVLAECYVGYAVSDGEIIKIAEGLSFEETDDVSLACSITKNFGGTTHAGAISQNKYLPLETAESIEKYETVTLNLKTAEQTELDECSLDITLLDIMYLDSTLALDENRVIPEEFSLFTDASGTFVPYPRTEIVKGDGVKTSDTFGETEYVKKKLVIAELKVKNTYDSEIITYLGGNFKLHLGHEEDIKASYVYNSIPGKYSHSEEVSYFSMGEEGKKYWRCTFSPAEEKICYVGFLVDEDMLECAYMLIGASYDYKYSVNLFE